MESFDQSPPGLPKNLGPLVGAIDQGMRTFEIKKNGYANELTYVLYQIHSGTSSTRFLVFRAQTGELVTYHSMPVNTYSPENSWAESDPLELLNTSIECINVTINNLKQLDIDPADVCCVGLTNQRETIVTWSKSTGKCFYNAILWHDTRTSFIVKNLKKKLGHKKVVHRTGLPISTYFSATKIKWLIDNVPEVKSALDMEDLMIGTVDTWLLWNLTGGTNGGIYVTDVTNARNFIVTTFGLHTKIHGKNRLLVRKSSFAQNLENLLFQ